MGTRPDIMAIAWAARHDPPASRPLWERQRPHADLNGDYTDFADLLRERDAGGIATSPDCLGKGLGTQELPEAF